MSERNRRTALTGQLRQGDVPFVWKLPIRLLFTIDSLPRLLQVPRAGVKLGHESADGFRRMIS
jgi:hypothetical protein